MPHNRFTTSHKIPEQDFVGIVYDFVLGVNAARCAERIKRSEKSVRRHYANIRKRYVELILSGSPLSMAGPNDPVWQLIYDCLFNCPNSLEKKYKLDEIDLHPLISSTHSKLQFRIPKKTKLGHCAGCPLIHPFEIDEDVLFEICRLRSSMRGFRKSDFGYYFFECFFRVSLDRNRGENTLTPNIIVADLLSSFREKPI